MIEKSRVLKVIKAGFIFFVTMLILSSSPVFAEEFAATHNVEFDIVYHTHIQNEGWAQGWVSNGNLSGSQGKGLRLEATEIGISGNMPSGLGIEYRTHIQNEGWAQGWVSGANLSGSQGKGLRLEAIQIRLTGASAKDYSVKYRTHIQNEGWAQGWVSDGALSGSQGKGLRLEALEIIITEKGATEPTQNIANVWDYGAKGNGVSNDTAAIQKALNENSTIYIPDGVYLIDVERSIKPKSNQEIIMSENAILKAIPTANGYHSVIRLDGVSNVTISGGKIVGERYDHQGSSGEWGMGITAIHGASDITIQNIAISNFWGDGIFLGDSPAVTDVLIDGVTCDNNRRQGLSITDAKRITVKNSVFKNTNGTEPSAGIDIEPDANQKAEDIWIENVECSNNAGAGISILAITGDVNRVEVSGSRVNNNHGVGFFILEAGDLSFRDTIVDNNLYGVDMSRDVYNASFTNMTFSNNRSRGVSIFTANQARGTENIIFEDSQFINNSKAAPGVADGAIVGNYDGRGFIRNVQFVNCDFYDDQAAKTQRYGLTIGKISSIQNVNADQNCSFWGNIYSGINSGL